MSATIDQTMNYALTAQAQIEALNNDKQITPHIEVIMPHKRPITLDGKIIYNSGKKIEIKLNLQNALVDPISVEGW